MKIYSPYKNEYGISQKFAKNANPHYQEGGLLGHTGWDMVGGHETPIYASRESYCYALLNKDNKNLMKYRAVLTLIEDAGVWYELSYGHLNDISVKAETLLNKGDMLGTQGNTGDVFSGGVKVTQEMKKAGSQAGSHLHLQLRIVKPVDKKQSGKKYLDTKHQGKYWEIPLYKNGFNGCVDIEPFFTEEEYIPPKPQLTSTLRYGDRGDQVALLQKILKIPEDGIFGTGTEKAVKLFQKANNLMIDGIVGTFTRLKLNAL